MAHGQNTAELYDYALSSLSLFLALPLAPLLASAAPALTVTASATAGTASIVKVSSIAAAAAVVASAANTVGNVATAAGLLQIVVDNSVKQYQDNDYITIPPGGRHQWPKMSLSLWQQGHCIRHRQLREEMKIYCG